MELQDIGIWVALLLGLCVGSFLNVVIYRMPRGMSVSSPRRSFCPKCEKFFPWWCNIPVLSWVFLGGKCRFCGGEIAFRYVLVELLTGMGFAWVWYGYGFEYGPVAAGLLCVLVAVAVVIVWIDAEFTVIPLGFVVVGVVAGLVLGWVEPRVVRVMGGDFSRGAGLVGALCGGGLGFGLLWGIAQMGKCFFGRVREKFVEPVEWCVRMGKHAEQEMLELCVGGEVWAWWDVFSREKDRVILVCDELEVDGVSREVGEIFLTKESLILVGGEVVKLGAVSGLRGKVREVTIPREAMGAGDAYLAGMLGTFCGSLGVVFVVVAATFLALGYAIFARFGRGRQLPFGPFLIGGAFVWLCGGWRLLGWYFEVLMGI